MLERDRRDRQPSEVDGRKCYVSDRLSDVQVLIRRQRPARLGVPETAVDWRVGPLGRCY